MALVRLFGQLQSLEQSGAFSLWSLREVVPRCNLHSDSVSGEAYV
jgi:hypothetical protein